ncbi:cytochrome c550 [Caryophanon latum]|uniref:Cytochrome C551 n=1 Tax=Caryophanon latum TaxID=33977 RepID=A0A1C0YTW1_9BACL|nr:cytochrome c [Caryophanon latum]OCS90606.1 cytochrome C551 [Caryophanon latum]
MKNNPIIPYILIMALGIGVIFFLSLEGIGNQEEIAQSEEEVEVEAADGEAVAKANCIGCHGGDLTGGSGPSLIGVEESHIREVIANGQGMMPGGLVTDPAQVDALVEYIVSLK